MKTIQLFIALFLCAASQAQFLSRRGFYERPVASGGGGGSWSVPLIAKWVFAEGSGTTVADSSGNGRTLNLNGSPTWGTGGAHGNGKYLTLNGTSQYGTASSIPLNTSGNDAVTIALWVRASATSAAFRGIWRPANASVANFACYHDSINLFRLYYSTADTVSGAVTANVWYHLVVRQPGGGGDGELWVNGVKQTAASSTSRTMATATFYVGGDEFSQYFAGDIAMMYVFGGAITDGEIATLAAE